MWAERNKYWWRRWAGSGTSGSLGVSRRVYLRRSVAAPSVTPSATTSSVASLSSGSDAPPYVHRRHRRPSWLPHKMPRLPPPNVAARAARSDASLDSLAQVRTSA
jgi:hypothetical protein